MTKRYPGGYITKNAPTVSTTSAPGIWTMEQQAAYQKAGTWPYGGPFNYIEDVFSTYLYTGNGSTQTITNGIDLAGKGGLTWFKNRGAVTNNLLLDTVRGASQLLISNLPNAQTSYTGLNSFNSNGFILNADPGTAINATGNNYVSWTFRKQAKFFDIVTWTGDGVANRVINHNLTSTPGCIIIKRYNTSGYNWVVWHRSLTSSTYSMYLDLTDAQSNTGWILNQTSTSFTVNDKGNELVNASGGSYIAYLFAHDAGGFGLTGTDNVISCGSYTGNGSATGPVVSLGYEPQWLLIKNATDGSTNWTLVDNMRGFPVGSAAARLHPNLSDAEYTNITVASPLPTGFQITNTNSFCNTNGSTYIYIAIRRGPMKTPTSGTSVFSAKTYSATTSSAQVTHDVTFDAEINANRDYNGGAKFLIVDSLRGINGTEVWTASTDLERSYPTYWSRKDQRTMYAPSAFDEWWASNSGTQGHISYGLVRAPGFFDEVCWTGTSTSGQTLNHNLTVAPELIISKTRGIADSWNVWAGNVLGARGGLVINSTAAVNATYFSAGSAPSSTVFYAGYQAGVNSSTNVAYLFATCPGVSKVGSYTGTGATQTIDCGFTGGARFVLIKRTNSTGDWYVWDTARGMVSGTDPSLLLNSAAAEVNANSVYTTTGGFQIVSTAAGINASGGTYLYLAIA